MAQQWTVGEVSLWLGENELADYQQVFVDNEIDGSTFLQMTERMSERLFPKVKDQVKFLSAVEKLKDGRQHKEKHTVSALQPMFKCKAQFPPAVLTALTNKDAALKSPTKNRLKNMLIQALFDHLSNATMYPSHVQYVELLRTVLLSFPFLKESYGSGYDALHESLRNKFKKERRPLVDVEEIEKMRQKYSVPNSGRKRSSDIQPCILLKKTKDINPLDDGEDERSTDQHVSVIKQECQKTRPNVDVIRTHLRKIQKYRTHYILQHTTEEVLREFPCLTIPVVLLEEASMLLKTDVDKKVIRGFSKLAAKLVSIAPNSNLKSLCLKSVDESQTDTERKGQMVNTAVLLLPSIFKENASHLFVINKDPHSPIPTIVLSSSDGKPLSDSTEVNVQMDGQKMILDSGEMDISLAMGIVFSLYHVYNVAYPSELKKTFCFLEAFVLNLGTLTTPVPVAVQRVANALNIS
ncbi:sterile alpha motif domain-containing protein 3 [Haplochromis burtoni]|uniref:sterile alpha motif domain-containing protein 3 n=1 Tax=Haplochromis burtoni TaxID=8153 RepID=UPI001C2D80CD|nr:sterile alpha motif domain-containing protein 3 [Haplochromis burtoni]